MCLPHALYSLISRVQKKYAKPCAHAAQLDVSKIAHLHCIQWLCISMWLGYVSNIKYASNSSEIPGMIVQYFKVREEEVENL